jgi:4-coumarate--CoA ligase
VQEILKVRGFQVAPAELEGHLLQHLDVADTCVVGVPDDYSGEVPFAFVVLSAGAAKRALQNEAEAAKIKADISKASPISMCCSRSGNEAIYGFLLS